MKLKPYDLFIFDWDGTLIEIKLLHRLNEKFNPLWKRRKRRSSEGIGNSAIHEIELIEKEEEKFSKLADLALTFYRPRLQKGSRQVLLHLKENGKKIAVFSNGSRWRIASELRHLGIKGLFDIVVSAQSIGFLKPSPVGLEMIARKMHTEKKSVLYIGDMADDVVAARRAGIDCCAIASGLDSYGILEAEHPAYLFKSMEAFYDAIKASAGKKG